MKLSKRYKESLLKIKDSNSTNLIDSFRLLKVNTHVKFDASVDADIRLGIDPRKSEQLVRGMAFLPHGNGKKKRVLVLCDYDKQKEIKDYGADYVGLDDYIEKIKKGWLEFESMIVTPNIMPQIGRLGKILGPRGLMPNPKLGTVTENITKTIKEIKSGRVDFRTDKQGIIHASIGKISFKEEFLVENIVEFIKSLSRSKPPSAKGTYFKSISISSTMSPGIKLDKKLFMGRI